MMHIYVYSLCDNLRVCEFIFIISIKWFLFLNRQYSFQINKIEKVYVYLELKLCVFIYIDIM